MRTDTAGGLVYLPEGQKPCVFYLSTVASLPGKATSAGLLAATVTKLLSQFATTCCGCQRFYHVMLWVDRLIYADSGSLVCRARGAGTERGRLIANGEKELL